MNFSLRAPARPLKQSVSALRRSRSSLEQCRLYHFSDVRSKERASFQLMKKDVSRSPHANKIPPTISPSTSTDPSKVPQAAPTTGPASSATPKPSPKSKFDYAALLPSSYYGDRPVAKPASLRRQRTKSDPNSQSTSGTATTATTSSSEKETSRLRAVTDSDGSPTHGLQMGDLAPNSIFADEAFRDESDPTMARPDPSRQEDSRVQRPELISSQAVLNPRPRARALWHRRMIIRSVRRRGRLTKEQNILCTERFSLSKSHFFKTSIKKLAPLARQIAGKHIDEAILQMRFSKKKAARDVLDHLRHAKNEAIVRKGMGLGLETPAEMAKLLTPSNDDSSPSASATVKEKVPLLPPSSLLSPHPPKPLASPSRQPSNADLSQMYVSQAWVNRGPYGKEPEYRAMGRTNILRPPHTGISVLLKEDRTKLREQREKEEKAERKRRRVVRSGDGGMWVPMPDRKVTSTNNHVLW